MFSLVEDSVRTLVKIGGARNGSPFIRMVVLAFEDMCRRNRMALHVLIDVQSTWL